MSNAPSILARSDDSALVLALLEGHPAAKIELFDRYVRLVERILTRILGHDAELGDLVHEVFARSFSCIPSLSDPAALKGWLTAIAVITARDCIRRRARGRWLLFLDSQEVPDIESQEASDEVREALRVTYRLLDRLGADDRIAFVLRYIEELELKDVAAACDVSLNTIKRRLARSERRFSALAEREPALKPWLRGGLRWTRA